MSFPTHLRSLLPQGGALVLLLVLTCVPAQAQSNGDGTIYSRFGIGTLADFSSSQSEALGGGGYALRSLNYAPTANPALLSDQVFTRLSAGGSFERVRATSSGDQSPSLLTSGTIEAIQFSFPIYKRTLGVGFTFQPYSQQNYRTQRRDELPVGSGTETSSIGYQRTFRGQGGLHRFRGGVGYRINETWSVGASADVIFGILQNKRTTEFEDPSFQNVTLSDDTRLVGLTGTFGSHLSFANVLKEDDALSLGASVALPSTLSGTRVLTTGEGRNLTPDTLESVDGETSVPLRSRFGLAYQPNPRWTFTADGLYEPWSNFSSDFARQSAFNRRFPDGGEETLTDRWRASLGAEVVPAGEDARADFLASLAYRLGVYAEQLYVRPDARTTLHTYAVTGGLSFPSSLSGTRIDLNLKAGTRGTTDDAFVRDTFYGVSLHVNFGERWFQKRKLR